MPTRDARWETVHAYMGPVVEFPSEWLEMGIDIFQWMEIRIELTHEGKYYWNFQRIHKANWDELMSDPDILKFLLKEMVNMIDNEMELRDV